MSLEYLAAGKSAQFFRPNLKRRLTSTSLNSIVKDVSRGRSGQFEDRQLRKRRRVGGADVHVTYACFKLTAEPSFLLGSPLRDEKYAYLLIIEAPEAIAVFGRNSQGVAHALLPFVVPWTYEDMGGLFIDSTAAYERLSLRGMSVGGNAVRRRSLEADDLSVSMATAGVHRSIPRNFRTRSTAGTHTITPGSSRVTRRDARASLEALIRWVRLTGAELSTAAAKYPASFLAEFCRAVPLSELPADTIPNATLFDFSQLRSEWEAAPGDYQFALARSPRDSEAHGLTEAQVVKLFDLAGHVFPITDNAITYTSPQGKVHVIGRVRINKGSINVSGGLLERVRIQHAGAERRLNTYANSEGNFLITFTNPEFGYSEGQLFRDGKLLGSIEGLLKLFEGRPELSTVTDEKDVRKRGFGRNGLFRFVEDTAVHSDAILVCDDLGDEWADYIAVEAGTSPQRLTFIHCKHGVASSSASALQVPIGQAIKNLSRMFRPVEEFVAKVDNKWSTLYAEKIPRIRRGGSSKAVTAAFDDAIGDPNTQRDVVLVLSGVSLATVAGEFDALKAGNARPHVSQLLWLLANFLGSCREHGVGMRILCRP